MRFVTCIILHVIPVWYVFLHVEGSFDARCCVRSYLFCAYAASDWLIQSANALNRTRQDLFDKQLASSHAHLAKNY